MKDAHRVTGERRSFRRVSGLRIDSRSLLLIAATAIGVYACFRMGVPFLSPAAWALCLAVLLFPAYKKILAWIHRPNAAAAVSLILAGLIIVAPGVMVGQRLVTETVQSAETLRLKLDNGAIRKLLATHTYLKPIAVFIEDKLELPSLVDNAVSWLTTATASLLRNSAIEVMRLVLTFYFVFYFLRDHSLALGKIKSYAPFPTADMDKLFQQIADTIHATVYGTVVVSLVQGALGGFMFWCLGLPAPLFWGFIMALLAIIPIFGAFVVWIPAAISLWLDGNWDKALLLTVWGALVVGGIDNWIYPMLVGSRLKLHTIVAFAATVGGLIVFGPCGIIVGPVTLTIMIFLLQQWKAPEPISL